jgi:DNA/RNA-binding domain of Phe-tRNA-synthetase-like protein
LVLKSINLSSTFIVPFFKFVSLTVNLPIELIVFDKIIGTIALSPAGLEETILMI